MGYEKVIANLAVVDQQISEMNIKLASDVEIVQQLTLVREFLNDRETVSEERLFKKWDSRFYEYYKAQLSVGILSEDISELATNQHESLRKYLKVILGGGISQGGEPNQARDWFYELSLASTLSKAGFDIYFREPDLVIEGNGLNEKIGIACKYPSSEKGVHEHISKGLSQLKQHGLRGLIALGIDQIVVEKANLKKFVDFNGGGKNPIQVLQNHADNELMTLVNERPEKYPSEDPVDEIIVSLSLVGHYGDPPSLVNPSVFSIHCTNKSPIVNDIEIIGRALEHLTANN